MEQIEKTGRVEWVTRSGGNSREIWRHQRLLATWARFSRQRWWRSRAWPLTSWARWSKDWAPDHVVWGTDALWTGSPQWQIEGLRRLEIPDDMQKKFGFKPLGAADGPLKTAIFSGNSTRLYNFQSARDLEETRPLRRAERGLHPAGCAPVESAVWIRGQVGLAPARRNRKARGAPPQNGGAPRATANTRGLLRGYHWFVR